MTKEDLAFIETDTLLEELFSRYEHAGFVGQRTAGEDDLIERLEMKGMERVVQGLCGSMILRAEYNLNQRRGPSTY